MEGMAEEVYAMQMPYEMQPVDTAIAASSCKHTDNTCVGDHRTTAKREKLNLAFWRFPRVKRPLNGTLNDEESNRGSERLVLSAMMVH